MFGLICGVLLVTAKLASGDGSQPCTCAAMDADIYDPAKTVPLIEQSSNILPGCDNAGSELCSNYCKDLADKTRKNPEGANDFCKQLKKDISNVYVHVFSKACDKDYQFTGSKSTKPLCCANGAKVPCASTTPQP